MITNEYVNINGVKQYISIMSSDDQKPILLYLHGGPGETMTPLMWKYNHELEKTFTVVIHEQRGAGKSYYKFSSDENICVDTFVDDIHELTKYLLDRFNQEKLYIFGHSWGSIIGIEFIQKYPNLVHKYIGCGQVINALKASAIARDFAIRKNVESNNITVVNRLQEIDVTYSQELWYVDLLFVMSQVFKNQGTIYTKGTINKYLKDYLIMSKNIRDITNREKGAVQSIKFLWKEVMSVNFENITSFEVPVIFIEGRHDYHVASSVVDDYYQTIKTDKQFYWFENSAHAPQWEEPEKFEEVLKEILDN